MQIVDNDKFRYRLRQVVEFLSEHLSQPPRLAALAEIAGMSAFHFLRVYAHHMGETPLATSRRLRMNQAWKLLIAGYKVGDVARLSGYGSSQAFSNAFRGRYGIPPSRVPEHHGFLALPPHIERIMPQPLAAITHRGTMNESVESFDTLFRRVHRDGQRVDLRQVYAVVHDHAVVPSRSSVLDACIVSPRRIKGVDAAMLPGGIYIVVRSASPWPEADEHEVARIARAARAAGYERTNAPLLARPILDPYRTAPGDRLWEILHPVRTARPILQ